MARNIEIKARARDFAAQQSLAESLANAKPTTLHQVDTFFNVREGRLKLREFRDLYEEQEIPATTAQLIFYQRPDHDGPKLSDYQISDVPDNAGMKALLKNALGIRHVVSKTRLLYLIGQTRIHFDQVDGLGEFIELEVVLQRQQSPDEGQREAQRLMSELRIQSVDLIDVAYVDLLEKAA